MNHFNSKGLIVLLCSVLLAGVLLLMVDEFWTDRPLPIVSPEYVDVDMGLVRERLATRFEFSLTNNGQLPLKIVGKPGVCTSRGCLSAVDVPRVIQPNESIVLRYVYTGSGGGPVEVVTKIFFDSGQDRGVELPVRFRGVLVPRDDIAKDK